MVNLPEKIAIGSDHAGFEMKEQIKKCLDKENLLYDDFGTFSPERVDYPDIAHPLAQAVQQGKYQFGILICGSGNGVAMVANKYSDVRAALCWNEEITRLARMHNDANIIILPGRFIKMEEAATFVKLFLTTAFEGGRHAIRVKKIPQIF